MGNGRRREDVRVPLLLLVVVASLRNVRVRGLERVGLLTLALAVALGLTLLTRDGNAHAVLVRGAQDPARAHGHVRQGNAQKRRYRLRNGRCC